MSSSEMDFQELLLAVQEALSEAEVQDLVFLCADLLVRKNLSSVSSGQQLFSLLEDQDLLSHEDPSLLLELLRIIKQNSLIRSLNGTLFHTQQEQQQQHISTYRRFLYEISESVSDQDLRNIKFLLTKTLPRRKLQKDLTLLQLFLEMEKEDHLGENNLDFLQKIIGNIHPGLEKRIIQYKAENLVGMNIAQETEKFPSVSDQPDNTPSALTSLSSVSVMEQRLEELHLSGAGGAAHMSRGQMESVAFSSEIESESSEMLMTQNPEMEQYEMRGDRRGVCLIINNYDFSACGLPKREGTDIDKDSLEAVFQWLGFEVVSRRDCDREQMLQALRDLEVRDHTQADCVVCCILSHGRVNGVNGVDGQMVSFRELRETLSHCTSLSHKPKLFFIQACRGTEKPSPVFPTSFLEDEPVTDAAVPRDSIPETADFLMAMSTVPYYVSYRERERGTWFIQALCHSLQLLVPRGVDLLSILTRVNRDVSLKSDKQGLKKQMPQPEFTLTKRLVFPRPTSQPPLQRL